MPDLPHLGCINIHASLLPRWYGAVPIHCAIEVGNTESGITLMQMDMSLDIGDMIAMEHMPIDLTDTTGTLHDTLTALDGRMVVEALAEPAQYGKLHVTSQSAEGIMYAEKIAKDEAAFDWPRYTVALLCQAYALNPFSSASVASGGVAIKFWQAEVLADCPAEVEPNTVLAANAEDVTIACDAGALHAT